MSSNRRLVFFIEWDTVLVDFLKGITLSPSLRGNIVVHIFYRHDISAKSLPKYKPWLFKHPAYSEKGEDSARKLLEAYVAKFKFGVDYSSMAARKRPKTPEGVFSRWGSSQSSAASSISSLSHACYVISKSTESYKQLSDAIYKKLQVKLELVRFHGLQTMLDFVQYKCPHCRIVFSGKKELLAHDKTVHGLVCPNTECQYHLKENSFRTESELQQHIKDQLRCLFCPTRVFCSSDMLEIHKRNSHKKCACPCGRYFGERFSYLDHFFAVYPSPMALSSQMAAHLKSDELHQACFS